MQYDIWKYLDYTDFTDMKSAFLQIKVLADTDSFVISQVVHSDRENVKYNVIIMLCKNLKRSDECLDQHSVKLCCHYSEFVNPDICKGRKYCEFGAR